ncbi:LPXTG cell wall anchor domain-containing protein [Niveispirillum sp. KHB5.9]|uniref:LPXTG cell wall anchor domain-containing protein n=1 Tax=Niveispirillum sp. KHB5.9 TaxID=3400269 RepID=UPI003A8C21BE
MRPFILVLIAAALGLGALTYATFRTTEMLAPLPTAGRGAVFAAFVGAGLLFSLFVWLQRKSRKKGRDGK